MKMLLKCNDLICYRGSWAAWAVAAQAALGPALTVKDKEEGQLVGSTNPARGSRTMLRGCARPPRRWRKRREEHVPNELPVRGQATRNQATTMCAHGPPRWPHHGQAEPT